MRGPDRIREPVEVITVDISYLAIADAIPQFAGLPLAPDVELVALVKPMFELHLARPPHRLEQLHTAIHRATTAITDNDWELIDEIESPIRGRKGAVEFFVHAAPRTCREAPLEHE